LPSGRTQYLSLGTSGVTTTQFTPVGYLSSGGLSEPRKIMRENLTVAQTGLCFLSSQRKSIGDVVSSMNSNVSGTYITFVNSSGHRAAAIKIATTMSNYGTYSESTKDESWWVCQLLVGSSGGLNQMTVVQEYTTSGRIVKGGGGIGVPIEYTFNGLDPALTYNIQSRLFEEPFTGTSLLAGYTSQSVIPAIEIVSYYNRDTGAVVLASGTVTAMVFEDNE
jgi:hypothetical protein